jgi:hypothetical protein
MATQIFVLLFGLALAWVGNMYSSLARRMRSFKSVPGKVIGREIVVMSAGTREGRYGEGGGYTPQVTYRYVVDGVEHESNKLARGHSGYKRAVAERKLAEIPDQVVVWYDPEKPSEAYLQKHGPALGYGILVLGVCLAGGAVISLAS